MVMLKAFPRSGANLVPNVILNKSSNTQQTQACLSPQRESVPIIMLRVRTDPSHLLLNICQGAVIYSSIIVITAGNIDDRTKTPDRELPPSLRLSCCDSTHLLGTIFGPRKCLPTQALLLLLLLATDGGQKAVYSIPLRQDVKSLAR